MNASMRGDAMKETAREFLGHRSFAVAGVSRKGGLPANLIYRRLRDAGYGVAAVNPATDRVEGDPCYARLTDVPGAIDVVVIATPPSVAADLVRECAIVGVRRVWLHRSFGEGSVSPEAVELARSYGMTVLDGGCPLMYIEPVDVAHRCMRWVLKRTGGLPDPAPLRG